MTEPFPVRFERQRAAFGPLVFGLDPSGALLESWGLPDTPDGLEAFVDIVTEAATGRVGLVKPQIAFYERHGWRGYRALTRLVAAMRAGGLLVILDAKRGDVGSTNLAYAEAYLGRGAPLEADALTVHPYLGLGAMQDLVTRAHDAGALLLVVTRSSNPEGRRLQRATTEGATSVEQDLLAVIGQINSALAPGDVGPVGAVIAPTHDQPDLDLVGANALFLAPGIGAQGADIDDVQRCFATCADRVMPSASRSLLAEGPDVRRLADAVSALAEGFHTLA